MSNLSFKTVQEMRDYMETCEKNKSIIQKIWEATYFPVYRFFANIFYFRKEIKWFVQRGMCGYSHKDLWNLGDYVLKILKEGTNIMKEEHTGFPYGLANEEWTQVLKEMSDGFACGMKVGETGEEIFDKNGKFETYRLYTKKEIKTFTTKYNKAMSLLKKHIFSLWD